MKMVTAMRTWKAILAPGLSLFLIAAKRPMPTPPHASQTWHCYRYENPWSGLTDSAEAEARTNHIRALQLPASPFNRIKPLEGVMAANDYILMRLPESREVTVNATYFSALERVDATRSLGVTPRRIGRALPAALAKFSPVQILSILLQYQVIQTYIHVESTVYLVKESKSENQWVAELRGQHIYFTNEKNVNDFAFRFILDLKGGEMRVSASD